MSRYEIRRMVKRSTTVAALTVAAIALGGAAAHADRLVYEYRVMHPLYGDIGTYTNLVDQTPDHANVETRMNLVVKLLGVVVHRQSAERHEDWLHGRLVAFHGVTQTNGEKIELTGEASGDAFIVHSPLGRLTAPANVYPSNPWTGDILGTNMIMSTKTGRLFPVRIGSETAETVPVDGKPLRLREYAIQGEKQQFVWLNENGIPVAFRTEEGGSMVDFVLTRYPTGEPQNWAGPPHEPPPPETLQQAGYGG
jgi:hypothetical protein